MGLQHTAIIVCDGCEGELRADSRWTLAYGEQRLRLKADREGWLIQGEDAFCPGCQAKQRERVAA